jgi:hypothetical protein
MTSISHSSQQNIEGEKKSNKKTSVLNYTIDQMHLNDYRIFHPTDAEYTFFSKAHEIFSKIHHILVHKGSLNKYKKFEIVSRISPHHNRIKLETVTF